jgi:hypothetical protein
MKFDSQFRGRHGKSATILLLCCVIAACTTSPPKHFDMAPTDAKWHSSKVSNRIEPRIAVMGVFQEETGKGKRLQRSIMTTGPELESLADSISKGIQTNPKLSAAVLNDSPGELLCPNTNADQEVDPKIRSCDIPLRIESTTLVKQLATMGFSHLLLYRGVTGKVTIGTEYTVGLVGGYGGAGPGVTTETTVRYTFKVSTRLFDLESGDGVSEVNLAVGASGGHGVMILLPYSVQPNETEYLEGMGRAIGEEYGRRFQSDEATE